jgi:hypothetical protein
MTLLTVRNDHTKAVNVTYISGSLTIPLGVPVNVANFSVEEYRQSVPEQSERSFEYHFKTHERMPSRTFQIALTVFYEVEGDIEAKHASTFFNQTTDILEPESMIDTEALGLVATFVGIIAFIGAPMKLPSK